MSQTNDFNHPMAPVLIGTCNRLQHFRNLIKSLQACYWVEQTELYVAIDAPYAEAVREVNQQITDFAKSIDGFAAVHLIIREENLGPDDNFEVAMDEIFTRHETLILLEDDNVVARNFLVYMNKALIAFRDDPKCYAVCGYHFTTGDIEEPSETDIFKAQYASAWGVAYWRAKFSHPDQSAKSRPDSYFLNPLNLIKVYRTFPHLLPMYMGSYLAGRIFGDTQVSLDVLKNRQFCVYPRLTRVINHGFDGSGVHCPEIGYAYHETFVNEDQTDFSFSIIKAINRAHLKANCKWFGEHINIRLHMHVYACLMYLATTVLSRDIVIKIRNVIKQFLTQTHSK